MKVGLGHNHDVGQVYEPYSGSDGLMYAKEDDNVVCRNSCKCVTSHAKYGEQAPDLTISEGSSIVDEKGSPETGREKVSKATTGMVTRGKMTS